MMLYSGSAGLISRLMIWFLLSVLSFSALADLHRLSARQGVMDLAYWRIDLEPMLPLSGDWLFYPRQQLFLQDLARQPIPGSESFPARLLDCRDLAGLQPQQVIRSLAQLPLPSEPEAPQQHPDPARNCLATYVLELRHLPEQPLAIMVPEVNSAFQLYWNDRLLAQGGQVSASEALFKPYRGNRIVTLPAGERRGVLILQVANLIDVGSVKRALILGDETSLKAHYAQGELWEALSAALAGVAGILLLLQQRARRRYEKGLWGLGVFCFALLLHTLTEGYAVLSWFIADPGWSLLLRLNMFSQNLMLPSLVVWMAASWSGLIAGWFRRLMLLQMLIWAPLQLFLPTSWLVALEIPVMLVNVPMALLVFIYTLFYVQKRRYSHRDPQPDGTVEPSLPGLALSMSLLMVSAVHDLILHQGLIEGRDWQPVSFLLFVICQIFLLAVQRARQHAQVESLNAKLSSSQNLLEHRVELRTRELQRKVDELEEITSEMDYLSRYDGLTGLMRQNHFMLACKHLLAKQRDSADFVSLILLDLDRYKHISAMFGPVAADQALKDIADLLDQWAEEGRVCSRLEGESFALLIPDMDEEGALHEAEWLRLRISQRSVMVDYLADSSQRFQISASFGVSTAVWYQASIQGLMNTAESALNQAKARGRNCVVAHNQPPEPLPEPGAASYPPVR